MSNPSRFCRRPWLFTFVYPIHAVGDKVMSNRNLSSKIWLRLLSPAEMVLQLQTWRFPLLFSAQKCERPSFRKGLHLPRRSTLWSGVFWLPVVRTIPWWLRGCSCGSFCSTNLGRGSGVFLYPFINRRNSSNRSQSASTLLRASWSC